MKNSIILWSVLFFLCSFSLFGQNSSSVFVPLDPKIASGDHSFLFDSKTWLGWRVQKEGPYGGGRFTIEDGTFCSDPAHPGLLLTTGQFSDFILNFEVQAEEDSDAFLLVRTSPNPKNLGTSCYAIVLAASSAHPERNACSFFGRRMATFKDEDFNKKNEDGTYPWNRFNVYVHEKEVRVKSGTYLNNECVDDESVRRGYIGFLVTKGKVRFRNITWAMTRTLPLFSLESRQLTFWNPPEKSASYTPLVDSMELNLKGGPGTLETKMNFDNFIFRAEFNAIGSESIGDVFFRCIPGEMLAGYRCQIGDCPAINTTVKTLNERVGSLVSLQEARNVGAQNDQWNSLILKAVDNHFQTWVNGIQTLDYSDRRPEDDSENPQNGLRLNEGTIQIYNRSLGTTLKFKSINITPVSKRWISKEEEWYLKEQRSRELLPPRPRADTYL